MWQRSTQVGVILIAGFLSSSTSATGTAVPFKPIAAYSPEAAAQREAAFLRKEGDRLQEAGRLEEAREKWLAAVEAYRRSGDRIGEGGLLFQIGSSYQSGMMSNPENLSSMMSFILQGLALQVEVLADLASRLDPSDRSDLRESDDLLRRASSLAEDGDCSSALPLFEEARQGYGQAGSKAGELEALVGRLRCQARGSDPFGALGDLMILPEVLQNIEDLKGKVKAGPLIRYLKAVEYAELGEWPQAEMLLRAVLQEFELFGDTLNASRAALDLGCVLAQTGRAEEARALYQRAGQLLAGFLGPEAFRNQEAVRRNLAELSSIPHWLDAVVAAAPLKQEPDLKAAQDSFPQEDLDLPPRARARRRGIFLLAQGDRLQRDGNLKAAREKWLAAADAYQRAEDPEGSGEAYNRLSESYAGGNPFDEGRHNVWLDYSLKALSALGEVSAKYENESPEHAGTMDQARSLRQQALGLSEAGECSRAFPLLTEAKHLYSIAGSEAGKVQVLLLEARCHSQAGNHATAITTSLEGISLAQSLYLRSPACGVEVQADDLFAQGRWQEALDIYQELLCHSERDQDIVGTARALLGLGKLLVALRSYSEAERVLQRALGLLPLVDEESGGDEVAVAREQLGEIYFATGRVEEGVAELRAARDTFRRAGRPEREVAMLRQHGIGLVEAGEYAAALTVIEEAQGLLQLLPGDPVAEADLIFARASIDLFRGEFQSAIGRIFRAHDLYQEGGKPENAWNILFLVAAIQDALGRHEEARALYQRIVDEQVGKSDLAPHLADFATLFALVKQQKFKEAAQLGRQIIPFWERSGIRFGEAIIRSLLGVSYLELGKLEEAQVEIDQVSRIARESSVAEGSLEETLNLAGLAKILGQLGQAGLLRDDARQSTGPLSPADETHMQALLEDMGRDLRKNIESIETAGPWLNFIRPLAVHTLTSAERYASRDTIGALRGMDATLAFLGRQAEKLTADELKAPFWGQFFPFYSYAVELSSHQPDVAFRYAEEARARAFVDQIGNQRINARQGANPELLHQERRLRLQLSRLKRDLRAEELAPLVDQDSNNREDLQRSLEKVAGEWEEIRLRLKATNPEYAALVSVTPLDLDEVQRQVLDSETTLVEYFLPYSPGDPVLAWVIERERATMVRLSISSSELHDQVRQLRSLIESRLPLRSESSRLYQELFSPLVSHIRHRNVVIVPHNVLHFLPFAALWDEKGGRYLGETWTLSFAPSATALKFAREKKARPTGPVLVAGNPDGSLSYAAEEAQAVSRLYGSEPLLGSAASEGRVTSQVSGAGILHLAAHAVLNPVNPLFTRVELAPDGEHDGSLEMHEVFGLDLSKTGLVVLSGCSTQLGQLSAGDEIEGLTRAFLYAGTPAVMSSLWDVEDESTSFLMERFYTHLLRGKGRAEALRKAQAETRRKFPHPYHWAAFVLTGDGR